MNTAHDHQREIPFRVLLVGRSSAANRALDAWIVEQTGAILAGPADTTADALDLARSFKPHVVLLDFHSSSVPADRTAAFLKELSPRPLVVVLTHDPNEIMRRRCLEAGADAIFDKTRDLEGMVALLKKS